MDSLIDYIKSTFNYGLNIDSKSFYPGKKLALLDKSDYNIYITPIHFDNVKLKQEHYEKLLKKAVDRYSEILDNKIKFHIIDTPQNVDIKIYWKRLNRQSSAFQTVENNGGILTLCISFGITDIYDKILTDDEIYHLFLHEFGHIMCLGHSSDEHDVMCGCGDWNTELTPNDIFVLKLIYKIGSGFSYNDKKDFIKKEVKKFIHGTDCYYDYLPIPENLLDTLLNIGQLKLYTNTIQNNIDVSSITDKLRKYKIESEKEILQKKSLV